MTVERQVAISRERQVVMAVSFERQVAMSFER